MSPENASLHVAPVNWCGEASLASDRAQDANGGGGGGGVRPASIRLDRRRLVRWLKAQDPAAVVGERSRCEECVLARFLAAQGALRPRVTPVAFRLERRAGSHRSLPGWARDFIFLIDAPIEPLATTAGRALEILEGIR